MKTRSVLVASILAMFIGTTSTPSVFAQKFKYKPLPKGKKAVTVPYVVNPGFSRALRENITRWSGVEMVRPNAAGGVARQVSASTVNPSSLLPAVERTVAARVSQTMPLITTDFLNGAEALAAFRPGWRSELMLSGFTRQQLDLVEQAFKETDQFLFETDEAGHWLSPRSAEWNYTDRYAQILTDNARGEMALNDGQIKTLFGKFSRLDDVFTRLNLQGFMLTHEGRAPKTNAPGKEGELARKVRYNVDKRDGRKMNPEVEAYVYGKMPAQLKKPVRSYGPKGRSPRRTPDEVYEEVVQFIKDNGRFPSLSAEDPVERSLRFAFDNACQKAKAQNLKDGTSVRLLALKAEHVNDIAASRTPQEVLEQVEKFMAEHNGRFPSQNAEDPVERSLRLAFDKACKKAEKQTVKDGTSMRLLALKAEHVNTPEARTAPRTPDEVYEEVVQFIKDNGRLPSLRAEDPAERSLRQAFDHACSKAEEQDLKDGTSIRLLALKAEHVSTPEARTTSRTPEEVYEEVVQFIKDNGRFPSTSAEDPVERSLRNAFNWACKKAEKQTVKDGTSVRLLALKAEHVNDIAAPRTPQEILEQVKAYRAAHNGQNPSQSSTDNEVKSLRQAWNNFHQKYKDVPLEEIEDEVARELEKLYRETVGGRN